MRYLEELQHYEESNYNFNLNLLLSRTNHMFHVLGEVGCLEIVTN